MIPLPRLAGLAALAALVPLAALLAGAAPEVRTGVTPGGIAWEATGHGPAVVLIHGSNLDRTMWDPNLAGFARRFRVIRYDLRAHGATPAPADTFAAWQDVAQVMDAAGARRAHVVGLSLGGRIALDFALAAPERVDRLVLIGPGIGGFNPGEMPAFFTRIVEAMRANDLDRALALLAESEVFAVPPADSGAVRAMVRASGALFRANPGLERPLRPAAITRLAQLNRPTLVVVGEHDMHHSRLCADTLARAIPDAREVVVPGARHLVNYHDPAAFDRLVIAFLAAKR